MIHGIGVDIVEVKRIKLAIEKNEKFPYRLLEDLEIENLGNKILRPEHIAGRFAAKEAVSKALGTGFRKFGLKDIIILNNQLGQPSVLLKGEAKNVAMERGDYKIHLSISHEKENAIAYAILEVN